MAVAAVTWFAPSLAAASSNTLFRLRGELPAPDDIVIVAIDDASLQRVGRWPWARRVMADALEKISHARPAAVGLDIIYAEESTPEEDGRLAEAIKSNNRVVLPSQLIEINYSENSAHGETTWLRPLPALSDAAAAIGHAHVAPDTDGVLRSVQLSKADSGASRLYALGLEVVRVADGLAENDFEEKRGALRFGRDEIPVRDEARPSEMQGVTIVRPNEMLVNYVGPPGAFRSYSIVDVIENLTPPDALTGKIVLIGVVAPSLGDAQVTPFIHYASEDRRQSGDKMSGIEVHANIVNTIRNRLWLKPVPGWLAFAVSLVVILSVWLTITRLDGWRQVAILCLILFAILSGSFIAFSRYLIVLPLPAMLTGFIAVVPLLLNRTLAASRDLDDRLAKLRDSQRGLLLPAQLGGVSAPAPPEEYAGIKLPHSFAWKLRAVDDITAQLVARMSFMNRVLASMTEGVLVTDMRGRILFANQEAAHIFGKAADELPGADLIEILTERGGIDPVPLRAAFSEVVDGHGYQTEFETTTTAAETSYFSLHLSAMIASEDATIEQEENGGAAVVADSAQRVERAVKDESVQNANGAQRETLGIIAIITDITKRRELDRVKTETLQLVSHELRTPLTSIRGLSDVLIKFPVAADEAQVMLDTIRSEAARLSDIINRYLDLTRLESGVQPLKFAPVPAADLIAGCIRSLEPLAAAKEINIRPRASASLPSLPGDAELLAQAINNLLSNAIKYSPVGSEVIVEATSDRAGVSIAVRDCGYGIPEAARARIFEKFYRLEREATSGIVGTGLGLPLVKEIVERHGGRITVESAPHDGSTFTIHLPLHPRVSIAATSD